MLGHLGMIAEVMVTDTDRARYGNYLFGAFGRDFVTADGERAMVVGLTDMQWSTLLKATGTADDDERTRRCGCHWTFATEGNRFRGARGDCRDPGAVVCRAQHGRCPHRTRCQPRDMGARTARVRQATGPRRRSARSRTRCSRCCDQPGVGTTLAAATPLDFSGVTPPARGAARPPSANTPTRSCSTFLA